MSESPRGNNGLRRRTFVYAPVTPPSWPWGELSPFLPFKPSHTHSQGPGHLCPGAFLPSPGRHCRAFSLRPVLLPEPISWVVLSTHALGWFPPWFLSPGFSAEHQNSKLRGPWASLVSLVFNQSTPAGAKVTFHGAQGTIPGKLI